MRLLVVSLLLFSCVLIGGAEPSAFELQSGVTKKEVKELKQTSRNTQSIITDFQDKINDLRHRMDGLKTVYQGLSVIVRNNSLAVKSQASRLDSMDSSMESYLKTQREHKDLLQAMKSRIDTNLESINKLDAKMDKINEAFTAANEEILKQIEVIYKTVQDLQSELKLQIEAQINQQKEAAALEEKKKKEKPDLSNKSAKWIIKEGRQLINSNELDKAYYYFSHLIDKEQSLATSNFYIGEIHYKKRDYNTALSYYKVSISHDDRASYMPVLLWHTAWSFKYLQDNENYDKFLKTLVQLYPKSEQGMKAKDLIAKSTKEQRDQAK